MDAHEERYGEARTDERPDCACCSETIDGNPERCADCRREVHFGCAVAVSRYRWLCDRCNAAELKERDQEAEYERLEAMQPDNDVTLGVAGTWGSAA